MQVDEPGATISDETSMTLAFWSDLERADGHDPSPRMRDVGPPRRGAGAVDHRPTAKHHVGDDGLAARSGLAAASRTDRNRDATAASAANSQAAIAVRSEQPSTSARLLRARVFASRPAERDDTALAGCFGTMHARHDDPATIAE